METNEAEKRRWNDEQWAAVWVKRERLTDEVTPFLLEVVALQPGEHVLDIGGGTGTTTLAASRAVGAGGAVVGADVSVPIGRLAADRIREAGATNVTFAVVDMQEGDVAGAPFDVAMSQFGVMFFDEPVVAFANIARQLKPGGRLAFVCWRTLEENPWNLLGPMSKFVPPPPLAAGKSPAGPFALADPERTTGILESAGFVDVHRTTHDLVVDVPPDAIFDEVQYRLMGVTPDKLPEAKVAVAEHLSQFRVDDETARVALAFQIFAATRA